MKSIEDIKALLSSNDIETLNLCDKFLDERTTQEKSRGDSAERRANMILGTLGASTALLVFIASNLLDDSETVDWLIVALYIAMSLWIARAVWYCIKCIQTQNRYRVSGETIFEVQDKSKEEALKELISGKLWELQRAIQPNTERLFYAQRAQTALVTFVLLLLFFGAAVINNVYFAIEPSMCFLFVLSTIGILFWFFGDRLIEKAGIWESQ